MSLPRTTAAPSSARRRLLRGSLSVPMVMTVASGSVLAQASNTCLQRLVRDPAAPKTPGTVLATSADSYLRVAVYKHPTNNNLFVKGADLAALSTQFDHFVPPTLMNRKNWLRIDNGNTRNFTDPEEQPTPTDKLVAVRIEEVGTASGPRFKITGVAFNDSGGNGVVATTGCIGSLMPGVM